MERESEREERKPQGGMVNRGRKCRGDRAGEERGVKGINNSSGGR